MEKDYRENANAVKKSSTWINFGFRVLAIALALILSTVVLLMTNAQPMEAYANIIKGSVGSDVKIMLVISAWIPLLLVTTGLLATFSAGLWNIGIEGQITLGAIFSYWVMRTLQNSELSPVLVIILAFMAGALGGALWAAFVGLLKIYGGVNEIFGGLGMNFVSTAITIWLIFGPWKRPGIGSMSGTDQFKDIFWLPTFPGYALSPWALLIGLACLALIGILLSNTYFGLRLKAVGKNPRAAALMSIPTARYMLSAFLICGALAGLAGTIQVTAVFHRLIPSIASGYGFLGLLVAMLVNYQALWVAPVSLFFAALNIGSIQLPVVLRLDSALAGVLQGAMVLFVLLMDGVRRRLTQK